MRLSASEERTRKWLEGMVANDPKLYAKNTPTGEAAAIGEIEIGLVNHYYLYLALAEQPDAPIANHFFEAGDPGHSSMSRVQASSPDRPTHPGHKLSLSTWSPTRDSRSTQTARRRPSFPSSTASLRGQGFQRSTNSRDPTSRSTNSAPNSKPPSSSSTRSDSRRGSQLVLK